MAIIITDDDVRKNLSMAECIEAMQVAFRDYADGKARSLPRTRYQVETPDPNRKYLCNVHVGAVPSYGMACVRAGSLCMLTDGSSPDLKIKQNPEPFNWTHANLSLESRRRCARRRLIISCSPSTKFATDPAIPVFVTHRRGIGWRFTKIQPIRFA